MALGILASRRRPCSEKGLGFLQSLPFQPSDAVVLQHKARYTLPHLRGPGWQEVREKPPFGGR